MAKRPVGPVEDARVRLRLLTQADLPLTLAWRNHDDIRRWFFSTETITPEQHAAWFRQYQERDDDFMFIIEDRADGCHPVGQTALYHVDWSAGRTEFGRLMIGAAGAAGKGLASAATRLALRIAFEQFGMREVHLSVFTNNQRALALYRAVGFAEVYQDEAVTRMTLTA